MQVFRKPLFVIALGALATALVALVVANATAGRLAGELAARAPAVIAEAGGGGRVEAHFITPNGWPSRHPLLTGGEPLDEGTRARIATSIAAMPGVGGIRWSDGNIMADSGEPMVQPLHCQEDVAALLRARTIRFEESSARIDDASRSLLGEVATALRPCLGSIILITGHTDSSGPEPGNIELSTERAAAVREALRQRGIPVDGLRATGVGSSRPVPGLAETDPANRRIEFSVIATETITPTPVDIPGPR